jgi:predicted secreted Zn-dependent protease
MDSLACFHDVYEWTYMGSTDSKSGVCKITSVNLVATYTITLPRWSGPAQVPTALVSWWKPVLAHFVWHESQHLAIAQSYFDSLRAAILAGPCTDAGSTAAFKAAQLPLTAAQAAFDAAQQAANWQWPPYSGPWS